MTFGNSTHEKRRVYSSDLKKLDIRVPSNTLHHTIRLSFVRVWRGTWYIVLLSQQLCFTKVCHGQWALLLKQKKKWA